MGALFAPLLAGFSISCFILETSVASAFSTTASFLSIADYRVPGFNSVSQSSTEIAVNIYLRLFKTVLVSVRHIPDFNFGNLPIH